MFCSEAFRRQLLSAGHIVGAAGLAHERTTNGVRAFQTEVQHYQAHTLARMDSMRPVGAEAAVDNIIPFPLPQGRR